MYINIKAYWQRIIGLSVLLLFCENINAQSFTLNGRIAGKDTGYIVLSYFRDAEKQRRSDTAAIRKGKFQFTGTVTGAAYADLITSQINNPDGNGFRTSLFVEPGTINISFKDGEANKAVIKGSTVQNQYGALIKYTSWESFQLSCLTASYNSIDSLLENALIDSKTAEEKRKEIDKIYNPIERSRYQKELSYTKEHPNSYVSLLMLYTFVGRLPNDSIDIIYSALSDKLKGSTLDYSFLAYNSRYRKAIAAEYPFDKLKVNEEAPPFSIYQASVNDSIALKDFKGKVILLEFWGLYCLPCLKANPTLEAFRKQYSKDKFEIIAINNNQAREIPQLISYISKNKLAEWTHVFANNEVKSISNLISKGDFTNYSGLGVPRTVLIDKAGRVVYKNYGYSSEEMEQLKLLIDKVVNEK